MKTALRYLTLAITAVMVWGFVAGCYIAPPPPWHGPYPPPPGIWFPPPPPIIIHP